MQTKAQKTQSQNRLRARRKAKGLCTECGARAIRGKRMCRSCQDKSNHRVQRRFNRLKAAGICIRCGQPTHRSTLMCSVCATLRSPAHKNNMYELAFGEYQRMLREQDNKCKMCQRAFDLAHPQAEAAPHIEHCHDCPNTLKHSQRGCADCTRAPSARSMRNPTEANE
jgi:hypothetical protein